MALSTKPYKGARDFYPEDKRLQKYIFSRIRDVVERYGYEEYDAPILEPLDIYLAKTGQEIVDEQTYVFEDRGGRKVVIRPEMTPTVSRMVAGKRQELAYPVRWYSIPNLWRYERPQRGRLREHWQLNVDIFGVSSVAAEAETINLVDDIYQAFDARRDTYEIRVNDRRLVNYIFETHGFSDDQAHDIGKLIDRMQKMERPAFLKSLDGLLTAKQREASVAEALLAFLEAKNLSEVKVADKAVTADLESLMAFLKEQGITNAKFDPTIMRGFDYYTGIVFEVYDLHPENNRSMMGGGRYDGLVGLFGVEPVATVGFGLGDVTLANFLALHHLEPELKPETQLGIVLAGEVTQSAQPLLRSLRKKGINIAVDYSGRKLGDQLKAAAKKQLEYVLIVGEDELKSKTYSLKNLLTGDEQPVDLDQLVAKLNT